MQIPSQIKLLLGQLLKSDRSEAVFARGAGGVFAVYVLAAGVAFALQMLIARILGTESFGRYVYVMTVSSFLILLMPLGLGQASLRFIPAYLGQQDWRMLRGFIRRSGQMVCAVTTITGLLASMGTWIFRNKMGLELADTFILLFLSLPLSVYLQLLFARLRAFKKPVLAQLQYQIIRPVLLGVTLAFMVGVLNVPATATAAMIATIFAWLVTFFFAEKSVSKSIKECLRVVPPEYRTGEWVRVGMQMMLIACFFTALNYSDTLMIGSMMNTTHAGIYSAAVRSSQLIGFGLNAVHVVLAPMISELYTLGRMSELQRTVNLAALGALLVSLPVFIVMLVFGEYILYLFGPEFTQGYSALVWLSSGQLFSAFCVSVGSILMMTGNQHYVTYVFGASALLNIVLNGVLIPIYGIVGGAIATTITMIMWNAILTVTIYKVIGINPTIFKWANRI